MMHQHPAGSREARVVTGAPRYRTLAEQAVVHGFCIAAAREDTECNVNVTHRVPIHLLCD
jgi:hypothetical protein